MHLDDASLARVRAILQRHLPAGTEVLVFGSRVRGRSLKPFSDLDLCLRGKQPLANHVLDALDSAFRDSDLPIKVDLVDWQRVTPECRAALSRLPFTALCLLLSPCAKSPDDQRSRRCQSARNFDP